VDPVDGKTRNILLTLGDVINDINNKMNFQPNVLYVVQRLPRIKEKETSFVETFDSNSEEWKSANIEDLQKFLLKKTPEIIIDKTAILDHFIDFDESFTINVDIPKKVESNDEQPKKKSRKRFWIF